LNGGIAVEDPLQADGSAGVGARVPTRRWACNWEQSPLQENEFGGETPPLQWTRIQPQAAL